MSFRGLSSASQLNPFDLIPDEILIVICSKLPSVDLISFSLVCKRFRDLSCEKSLVQHLDFAREYNLRKSSLSSFLDLSRNIRVLNLNQCYWIGWSSLVDKVTKLKELQELHILDCCLTFRQLEKIVSNTRLTSLSLSWPRICAKDWLELRFEDLKENLTCLRHLVLQMSVARELSQITHLLRVCEHLETLDVSVLDCFSKPHVKTNASCYRPPIIPFDLGKLRKLKFSSWYASDSDVQSLVGMFYKSRPPLTDINIEVNPNGGCHSLLMYLVHFVDFDIQHETDTLNLSGNRIDDGFFSLIFLWDSTLEWKCRTFILDYSPVTSDTLHSISLHCIQLNRLSLHGCHLLTSDAVRVFQDVCIQCNQITELDLTGTHVSSEDDDVCAAIANLKGLRKLGLTRCMLAGPNGERDLRSRPCSRDGTKRRRIGLQTSVTESDLKQSRLWALTENCPNLTDLQICGSMSYSHDVSCGGCNAVLNTTLFCISRWRKLQNLTLFGLRDVRHGHFLSDIVKSCRKLESLKLIDVGPRGDCVFQGALTNCLSDASSLRDLSLIHKQFKLNALFCNKLESCSNVERLLIFTSYEPDRLVMENFAQLSKKLLRLFVVYMKLGASLQSCKTLRKKLMSLTSERPAMDVSVVNLREDDFPKTFHLKELTFRGIIDID